MSSLITLAIIFSIQQVCTHSTRAPDQPRRSLGGVDSKVEDYPYVAFLVIVKDTFYNTCTGAIINQNWLISAAHCIDGNSGFQNNTWYTIVGISRNEEIKHAPKYYIETYAINPFYEPETRVEDLALFKVNGDLTMGKGRAIPIGTTHDIIVGNNVTLSGWGLNEYQEMPNAFQTIKGSIESLDYCLRFQDNSLKHKLDYTKSICTTEQRYYVTKGDCGAPLVYQGRLIGIYSRTIFPPDEIDAGMSNQDELDPPSYIHVNVPAHRDWILKTIAAR